MTAFYNEIDPFAAQWLRNLIDAGHIAPGVVDSRSIEKIKPEELDGYTQVHFFAGIGAWSYALRLAGWPDDRPVWTGSCPCQPFSDAGEGRGFDDERHLWPVFASLIRHHRPHVVFGEQVSSKDGLAWFDVVRSDLEGEGYACGALDTCAASVGAPHRRQRLFFVAGSQGCGDRAEPRSGGRVHDQGARRDRPSGCGSRLSVGDSSSEHLRGERGERAQAAQEGEGAPRERERLRADDCPASRADRSEGDLRQSVWDHPDWALCDDPSGPRWRPIEPGTFPLAHGAPDRVGRLRGYGNAIVPQVAAEFVGAFLEVTA